MVAQAVKDLPDNAGDQGLITESGRSPREGNGNPPQYSYLENSMERGAWWATVHEWDMTEQLTLSVLYDRYSVFSSLNTESHTLVNGF